MKILVILSQIPLPLIDGGKKVSFYTAANLKKLGHSLVFICLNDIRTETEYTELSDLGEVHIIPHDKMVTVRGAVQSLFSRFPYYLNRFHRPELNQKITEVMDRHSIDLALIEGLHCAEYGILIKQRYGIPVVLRSHNFETAILKKYIQQSKKIFEKCFLFFDAVKLKHYEKTRLEVFDLVITITEHDEQRLKELNRRTKTMVLPAGVDIEYFSPEPMPENTEMQRILWVGALNWPPNRDSLSWFLESIFPKVLQRKSVILDIIGSNPPENIIASTNQNIQYHGQVKDVREYFRKAVVCVVPLRIGSGMRVKILEFMASGRPVISTSLGSEGIPVTNGENIILSDLEDDFAEKILELLEQKERRDELSRNARVFVENNYAWTNLIPRLNSRLEELIQLDPL